MPYYHVIINSKIRGQEQVGVEFNLSEERVRETIANPYMKNQSFTFGGKIVNPSDIIQILICSSEKLYESLVLPNGKSPTDETDGFYILKSLGAKKIEGVQILNFFFLTSPPQAKEKTKNETTKKPTEKKKVFIVHGKEKEQALELQKYLTKKLKIDAVIFDDLPDKGKTIIEQLEYVQNNVGYAFAIVTPDDVGCLVEDIEQFANFMTRGKRSLKVKEVYEILDTLLTRPRQNVIFELGLFIGALGRDKVRYLLQKDVKDLPSDLKGILYKSFDKSVEEVFHEIADEMKEG